MLRCFFLLSVSNYVWGQKIDNAVSFRDINKDSYFRFSYDNDYFAATDKNYTQGYNFELIAPWLQKNPVNYLLFNIKGTHQKYGISWEHIGFTPHDYVNPEIQFGDRPFASTIMLKSFSIVTDTVKKSRFAQSLSIGAIGPVAFGKQMQVGIHRALNNRIPGGWDNQIKNDLILNYRMDYERELAHFRNLFSIQSYSTLQFGSLFTNLSSGINAQLGIVNSPLSPNGKSKQFRIFLYAQPILSAVAYDATLQGGLFNGENLYSIAAGDIERFTAQFNYGIILKTKRLYFEYTRTTITREFNSGNAAAWGGARMGFTF